jgi:ferredoxin-thioredoxin reductase catalytic subunit
MTEDAINKLYQRLKKEAENSGYHLNPDETFTLELLGGLLTNEKRFGYWACPCRLAEGVREEDLDIICPCDYRDDDLAEYGACYCALYVSSAIIRGEAALKPVPERRPPDRTGKTAEPSAERTWDKSLAYPVWRCKVCGYLCAREQPPEVCPICKAKKERFERFI